MRKALSIILSLSLLFCSAVVVFSGIAGAEAPSITLSVCDSAAGWMSPNANLTTDTSEKREGSGSLKFTATGPAGLTTVLTLNNLDITGFEFISFELWVNAENTNFFNAGGLADWGLNFDSGPGWGTAYYSKNELKAIPLTAGWNTIKLPLSGYAANTNVDLTKLTRMRFFSLKNVNTDFIRIDNVRLLYSETNPGLITDCDSLTGWTVPNGASEIDTIVKNEGFGSLKATANSTAGITFARTVSAENAADFSGMGFISFDLWVGADNLDFFSAAPDCGINFHSAGTGWHSEFRISKEKLQSLTLTGGWNTLKLALPDSWTDQSIDITKIIRMRIYSTKNINGKIIRIDNFKLIQKPADPGLMSNCDSLAGWTVPNGASEIDTIVKNEGFGSLKATANSTAGITFARTVSAGNAADFSGMEYISFDLWVGADNLDFFSAAPDCGINFHSAGTGWHSEFRISKEKLQSLTLTEGWNTLKLALPESWTDQSIDITKIIRMRIYSTKNINGKIIRIDNFRLIEKQTDSKLITSCDFTDGWIAGTGVNLSIDSSIKTEGAGSLKADVSGNKLSLIRAVDTDRAESFVGKSSFSFDLWVSADNLDLFIAADDCAINFDSTGSGWSENYKIGAQALKSLTLIAGWNTLTLPLPAPEANDIDYAGIIRFRIYSNKQLSSAELRLDNFKLIDKEVNPALISDCESLTGWTANNAALSLDSTVRTEGWSSLKAEANGALTVVKTVTAEHAVDFTGKGAISFSLWVSSDNLDFFSTAPDCGVNFHSADTGWSTDYRIMAEQLKSITLSEGWNTLTLYLPDSSADQNFDISKVIRIRIYSTKDISGKTVRFDNFKLSDKQAPPPQPEPDPDGSFMFNDCDTLAGWATDAVNGTLSIDGTQKIQGTGSLSLNIHNNLMLYYRVPPNLLAIDFTKSKYLAFDLWVDTTGVNLFLGGGDCGINFVSDRNTTLWDDGRFAIKSSELGQLNLEPGWNEVILPLPEKTSEITADLSNILAMRLYVVSGSPPLAGQTVKFDRFRLLTSLGSVIKDNTGLGISVEAEEGAIPNDSILEINEANVYQLNESQYRAIETNGYSNLLLLNISLRQNDVAVPFNGKVKFSVPLPAGFSDKKILIYQVAADGKMSILNCDVKNHILSFVTQNTGIFAILQEGSGMIFDDSGDTEFEFEEEGQPDTGDIPLFIVVILSAGAVITIFAARRKNRQII